MAVNVKRITVWSQSQPDQAGLLGRVLEPLARARGDLQVVMGYHVPSEGGRRGVIEIAPVKGKKAEAAARQAGFAPSDLPALLITGDNRPGIGQAIGQSLGQAGISIHYLVAQVIGRKYQAVAGFGSEDEAARAATIVKKAVRKK